MFWIYLNLRQRKIRSCNNILCLLYFKLSHLHAVSPGTADVTYFVNNFSVKYIATA